MEILFIAYIDFDPAFSGSGVRPQRMYRAFLDAGCEVKLLACSQERRRRERRRAAVEEISRWLDTNTPALCYIESPVYPILWGFDRALLRKIRAKGIPIGYFYRDFHDKFPRVFPKRTDPAGRCKELWLGWKRAQTDALLRQADIVYLPSAAAKTLFSYRDMRPLPPGGEDRIPPEEPEGNVSIYVGGVLGTYGGIQLLDTFERLNESGDYPLILVCREAEWDALSHPCKEAPWLEVRHVSGEELEPLYRRASLALCLNEPNPYDDYTVSVKLYEYLGHGLPLVVNAAAEMERIVSENGVGLAVPYGAESAAEAVRRYFSDEELRRRLRKNAAGYLRSGNLWVHRARQVIRELTKGESAK